MIIDVFHPSLIPPIKRLGQMSSICKIFLDDK